MTRRDRYANPSERVRFGSLRFIPPFGPVVPPGQRFTLQGSSASTGPGTVINMPLPPADDMLFVYVSTPGGVRTVPSIVHSDNSVQAMNAAAFSNVDAGVSWSPNFSGANAYIGTVYFYRTRAGDKQLILNAGNQTLAAICVKGPFIGIRDDISQNNGPGVTAASISPPGVNAQVGFKWISFGVSDITLSFNLRPLTNPYSISGTNVGIVGVADCH